MGTHKKPTLTKPQQDQLVLANLPTNQAHAALDSDIHAKIEYKIGFADLMATLRRLVKVGFVIALETPPITNLTRYYKATPPKEVPEPTPEEYTNPEIPSFTNQGITAVTNSNPDQQVTAQAKKRGRPPKQKAPEHAPQTQQQAQVDKTNDVKTNDVKAQVVTEPIIKLTPQTSYTLTVGEQSFGPFMPRETWHGFTQYISDQSEIIVIEDTPSFLDKIWGFGADIDDKQIKILKASPDIALAVKAAYKGSEQ